MMHTILRSNFPLELSCGKDSRDFALKLSAGAVLRKGCTRFCALPFRWSCLAEKIHTILRSNFPLVPSCGKDSHDFALKLSAGSVLRKRFTRLCAQTFRWSGLAEKIHTILRSNLQLHRSGEHDEHAYALELR